MSRDLSLGFGSDPEISSVEKSLGPSIRFKHGPDVGTIEFNGTDWDVSVNGVQTGTIPGGGGGGIASVQPGDGIEVDATDPDNPEVSARLSEDANNFADFGSDGGIYVPTPTDYDIISWPAAPNIPGIDNTVPMFNTAPTTNGGATLTAGQVYYVPFLLPLTDDYDAFVFRCTSASGTTGLHIGLRTVGSNGAPDALVCSVLNVPMAGNTKITATFPSTNITKGWYYLVLQSTGTVGMVQAGITLSPPIGITTTANSAYANSHLIHAGSYSAGTFPAVAGSFSPPNSTTTAVFYAALRPA